VPPWPPGPLRAKEKKKHSALVDAALGAFAVCFTQSPSFLAYQRDRTARKGQSNAHPFFGLVAIPSDNQMRALLDPVSPESVVPVFHHGLATLEHPQQRTARKEKVITPAEAKVKELEEKRKAREEALTKQHPRQIPACDSFPDLSHYSPSLRGRGKPGYMTVTWFAGEQRLDGILVPDG
jgi:hypothetical protein